MSDVDVENIAEIDVPVEAVTVIDSNVEAGLPTGTILRSIIPDAASFGTRCARLIAEQDGVEKEYFIKTSANEEGYRLIRGEFSSLTTIYKTVPDLCPVPIAQGTYESNADIHFYICSYHDLTGELPDLETFPARLAEMHRHGLSQNGKFGFPITTHYGQLPLEHTWTDTWEEYFAITTRRLLAIEQKVQGQNEEIEAMMEPFFAKVIPRLLRPLETGGRSIRPCLVHGDLRHGNATMDGETNQPIVLDPACFYAHNEYDLGIWRASWNNIGESFVRKYHEDFPVSPPARDREDRNALYALRFNILDSILHGGYEGFRESLASEMKRLIDKFPEGVDSSDQN